MGSRKASGIADCAFSFVLSFGGVGFAVYSVKARLLDMGVRGVCTPLYKPLDVELSGVDGRDPFATAISV